MGAWGPKLYQDDVAEDIKSEYPNLLKCGKSNEEATKELIKLNHNVIKDDEDAPIFWFALADIQWKYGRLLPEVKEKAIEYLKNGADLKKWKEGGQKEYKIREKVLNDLEDKLNSPLPKEKKVTPYTHFKTDWKNGDTYAYRLESEYAKEKGLYGRYVILHTIDETAWPKGEAADIFPICYVKISRSTTLPDNKSEIDNSMFLKYLGNCYRYTNITKSRNKLKRLVFLGSYSDITLPTDELIRKKSSSIAIDFRGKNDENRIIDAFIKLYGEV